MENNQEMEMGKIYFISFGANTQLVVRYKCSDTTNHHFFDSIHYWNGFETYRKSICQQANYCLKSGIEGQHFPKNTQSLSLKLKIIVFNLTPKGQNKEYEKRRHQQKRPLLLDEKIRGNICNTYQ